MLDPTDAGTQADPYAEYARIREAHPVWQWPHDGTYLITRYEDVHAAWRDRRFGSSVAGRSDAELDAVANAVEPWRGSAFPQFASYARWDLLALEPPDHTRLRRLVTEVFTPRAVEALRDRAATMVRDRLDHAGETLDVVRDLAAPLSLGVICDLIGVPAAARDVVLRLSHRVVQMYEPTADAKARADAEAAVGEFQRLVGDLIVDRRRRPRADLVSGLLESYAAGDPLADAQIASTVMLLLMAGHEASVNAAANGIAALASHPAEWRALRSGEVRVPVAVEEILRWDPPLQLFRRWVLEAGVEIGGSAIPRGARVGLLIGSANRDPRRFDDPDAFRVARGEAAHLAFGGGIHFCLGAPLARLELQVLIEALLRRAPALVVRDGAVRRAGFQFRGYDALPIALTRSA